AGAPVKGDTDVPEKATGIAWGMIVFGGKGRVWIDDSKLEAVGKDVKVPAETPAEAGGEGLANSDGLPEAPVNLGFEDGQGEEARVQAKPLADAERAWLKKAAIPLAAVEAGKGWQGVEPLKEMSSEGPSVSPGGLEH